MAEICRGGSRGRFGLYSGNKGLVEEATDFCEWKVNAEWLLYILSV